ncbi:GNAT family N-acetyltransferase [Paenibacillus radicis (ex Xue et al. 2023)]|uniref:GNAT family N-acetyltransferase n=1 Tax=Paenibacillus radicis (ex Xue et al. 2023) TaxID=2972489 RepID=A0ABT1YL01_9BACL|nr:GNAT family N-acetyltransferase [Paenibacillus radicis (ex Xue et al. 2023)]MCR8633865.1 GNAT family N-acetyltransferase [Paenibacillus radicis (ex Xue et al. 2023)]
MKIQIRYAQIDDIADIQHVAQTTWHLTYKGIIPEQVQRNFLSIAYSDGNVRRRMERSLLLVAESEGEIVGFANFSKANTSHEAELWAIYVAPEHQGKGIGSELIQRGLNDLTGITCLFLNVERENHAGIAFYTSKGFSKVNDSEEAFNGYTLKTTRMVLNLV